MRRTFSLAIACATAFWVPLAAQAPATQTPDRPATASSMPKMTADAQFAMDVAGANLAEVELGKLAADKAASEKAKAFANRMVNDHTKSYDELKALAATKHINVPTAVDAKHKMMRDKLAGLSGAAFDKAYIDEMVKGHQGAVTLFRKEATTGADAELKAWAAKVLPTVEEHFKMAQDLQKEMGAMRSSS